MPRWLAPEHVRLRRAAAIRCGSCSSPSPPVRGGIKSARMPVACSARSGHRRWCAKRRRRRRRAARQGWRVRADRVHGGRRVAAAHPCVRRGSSQGSFKARSRPGRGSRKAAGHGTGPDRITERSSERPGSASLRPFCSFGLQRGGRRHHLVPGPARVVAGMQLGARSAEVGLPPACGHSCPAAAPW